MRALYTLMAIFTVGIASAQQSQITVSQISSGDNTYTHIKGDDNRAENCFEESSVTSSSTLAISVDGLAVDVVYIDGVAFNWTGSGAEALAISFGNWDDYNRIYLNRGSQRPIYEENSELLNCSGWTLDASGQWYTNSGFAGYSYNIVVATSGNNPYAPQLVFNPDGGPHDLRLIADGGDRIYVGSFTTNAAAVAAVEAAILLHMNPPADEPEEEEETAVDAWVQGGVVGWLPPAGYDSAWSNARYPGFAFSIDEWTTDRQYAEFNPHLIGFNLYIGSVNPAETSGWSTGHIGTYRTRQEAIDAGRQYIIDNYDSVDSNSLPDTLPEILTEYQGRFIPPSGRFVAADFANTYSNAGWLAGIYEGGLTNYTITAPTQHSNQIEVNWIWTDSSGFGHTMDPEYIEVQSTTYYIYWNGDRFETLEALRARYPRGSYTELHSYEQAHIDEAQAAGVALAIRRINEFINRD